VPFNVAAEELTAVVGDVVTLGAEPLDDVANDITVP
jgi:hypothetical protein